MQANGPSFWVTKSGPDDTVETSLESARILSTGPTAILPYDPELRHFAAEAALLPDSKIRGQLYQMSWLLLS